MTKVEERMILRTIDYMINSNPMNHLNNQRDDIFRRELPSDWKETLIDLFKDFEE